MREELIAIAARIEACTLGDRRRLIARVRALRSTAKAGGDIEHAWAGLLEQVEKAEKTVAARRARLPAPVFSNELPVSQRREEIAEAIRKHQVVVVCGETGSGKTTQLPKICLSIGLGARGLIGHTQPRRIAARSVAQRIAEELETPLGAVVGYKVRFGDQTGPSTVVKLMTDGILLAETQGDRDLEQYEVIIIDEAHERGLNIDFLLGYLKTLLPRRPDLKVIVTSATIDPERFSRHFGNAPIIMVEGRTFPVEVLYRPPPDDAESDQDDDFQAHMLRSVDEAASYGDGDMLIFLSGEREIRETAESLRKHRVHGAPSTKVLPLYAKLSASEQMEVFRPHPGRRIVLATNVAETSLTVPGIRFVIDPGHARLNRYSPRTKVQRLEIERVSRASADQRKGRCGRIGPGICIRMYSEDDFQSRTEFTDPEIVRTNLASVILQMAALRLGAVEEFPFIDPPDSRLIKDGRDTLYELGAMTEHGELTPIGTRLAHLPVDPRIGRMILAAHDEGCLAEVLVIASGLSLQDPRERPLDKQNEADESHVPFRDERSDFLAYIKLWQWQREQKKLLSGSRFRKLCKERFLSFMRLREWEEVHSQIAQMAGSVVSHDSRRSETTSHARNPQGVPGRKRPDSPAERRAGTPRPPANKMSRHPLSEIADINGSLTDIKRVDAIHRALVAGLLGTLGMKTESGEFLGARGNKFQIFPGSSLFRNSPRWVVASEIVRTTKVYARCVAGINPEWLERIGEHLLKRSYFNPHWHRESGRVVAYEKATLFGLEIIQRRRVHYGVIDPIASRGMFIHHALVEHELNLVLPCIVHNAELVIGLREFESRVRKQGLLAHPTLRYEFFDKRIPDSIVTAAQFERWYRDASRRDPNLLFMSVQDVVEQGAAIPTKAQFPDTLQLPGTSLVLRYKHAAGAPDDGITAVLPFEVFGKLTAERAAWLVPGWLGEIVDSLLRGLGREWRRMLPAATTLVPDVLAHMKFGVGSLFVQVSEAIRRVSTHRVPADVLEAVPLPDYLKLRIEVVDSSGKVIASGRSVPDLRTALAPLLSPGDGGLIRASAAADPFHRDGLKAWDWPNLDVGVKVERYGTMFTAYPGIVDQKTAVGTRLFEAPAGAAAATRAGLRRLFVIDAGYELARRIKGHPELEKMVVQAAALGDPKLFRAAFVDAVAARAFFGADPQLPVTKQQYEARRRAAIDRIDRSLRELANATAPIMDANAQLRRRLSGTHPAAWAPALADIGDQIRHLVPADFLASVPSDRLAHLPRYLAAIDLRLQRLNGAGVLKDERHLADILPIWRSCLEAMKRQNELGLDAELVGEFRWLVEELRVSLFAQELRTPIPVSVKRLHEFWTAMVKV